MIDVEMQSFAFGDDIGQFCARVYAAMVEQQLGEMADEQREAAEQSQEWFNSRILCFEAAVDERAREASQPEAFFDGWRSGFRAQLNKCWPVK
jgi:hypothetical protein